jgi:hypothetical protein
MNAIPLGMPRKETLRTILIDLFALSFIYLAPTAAHLLNFPVYMLEPMRLMLIVSLAHSSRKNSYILALTLPLFSFLVSGHPELLKMLVITAELALNVFLFYLLLRRGLNMFVSALMSIVFSKLFCYLLYLAVFSWAFVQAEAAPLFLGIQVATTLVFSGYLYVISRSHPVENRLG